MVFLFLEQSRFGFPHQNTFQWRTVANERRKHVQNALSGLRVFTLLISLDKKIRSYCPLNHLPILIYYNYNKQYIVSSLSFSLLPLRKIKKKTSENLNLNKSNGFVTGKFEFLSAFFDYVFQ